MSKLNVEPNREGGDLASIVAFEGKASKFSSPLKIVINIDTNRKIEKMNKGKIFKCLMQTQIGDRGNWFAVTKILRYLFKECKFIINKFAAFSE